MTVLLCTARSPPPYYFFVPVVAVGLPVLAGRSAWDQELCESRGGRPGLPVLMSLMVSVGVKQH